MIGSKDTLAPFLRKLARRGALSDADAAQILSLSHTVQAQGSG